MNPLFNFNTQNVKLRPDVPDKPRRKIFKPLEGSPDVYILEIDNSSTEGLTSCDRKALWQLIYGREPHRKSALTYGSAIHNALETYYKGERDLGKIMEQGLVTLQELAGDLNEWRGPVPFRNAIEKYIEKYRLEDNFEVVHTEEAFGLPLCDIIIEAPIPWSKHLLIEGCDEVTELFYVKAVKVVWTGKIDLIVQEKPDMWVVDHKTTSIEGETFWRQFDLSQQFIGYTWAGRKLGYPVAGTKANVIYGKAVTKTGRSLDFLRNNFYYTDEQVEEWEADVKTIISDFIHHLSLGFFPKKTQHCVSKYGTCPYLDVCRLPSNLRLTALNSATYADRIWSPFDD